MLIGVHPKKRVVALHASFFPPSRFSRAAGVGANLLSGGVCKCRFNEVWSVLSDTVHNLSALSSLLLRAVQCKNKHSHFLFQAPASFKQRPCLPMSIIQTIQWERGMSEPWESTERCSSWDVREISAWHWVGGEPEKSVIGVWLQGCVFSFTNAAVSMTDYNYSRANSMENRALNEHTVWRSKTLHLKLGHSTGIYSMKTKKIITFLIIFKWF